MRKKMILFGSGQAANKFLTQVDYKGIDYIVDNDKNKWGSNIEGIEIFSPIKIKEDEHVFVIITSMYYDEISRQLKNDYKLSEGIDFIYYELYFAGLQTQRKEEIAYPTIVNFPVTNKCNFRCAMCNVWKPEYSAHKDLTPTEIGKILRKKIFSRLSHIGISGGEPFVRKDLEQVIETMVENSPRIKSISIITNGSIKNIYERVINIKSYLDSKQISFSLQVSIDGVGTIHDLNRGKEGAFDLMYNNFLKLNALGVVNEISTTITKKNINNLWENHLFARKHNVYIRYRLATNIARLYNDELKNNYTFNDKEKLLLIKFFENIINNYEKNLDKKIHYYSLINILNNGKRLAGCQYQTSDGVSLDPYGNIHFCFPFSEKIENINNDINYDCTLLEENKDILLKAKKNCESCIHDYSGPYTPEGTKILLESLSKNQKNYNQLNCYLNEYKLRGVTIER